MTLEEMYGTIESPKFTAQLTVASDLRTFLRAAQKQAIIQELAASAGEAALFNHIHDLLNQDFDRSFQSPWDASVAVYLWILCSRNEDLAREAAEEIAQADQDRWWWAGEMASEIINGNRAQLVTPDSGSFSPKAASHRRIPVQIHVPAPGPGEQNQSDG